jgi:hypothetical protein
MRSWLGAPEYLRISCVQKGSNVANHRGRQGRIPDRRVEHVQCAAHPRHCVACAPDSSLKCHATGRGSAIRPVNAPFTFDSAGTLLDRGARPMPPAS